MDPRLISSDSHVVEPPDLWTRRIDRAFRESAPRVEHEMFGLEADWFVCENLTPFPVAGLGVAGVDPRDYPSHMPGGYAAVRPAAWDPVERLKDQDVDGISAEVLYPSLAMMLFSIDDAALRAASFRAYNDWLVDFCSHERSRLIGIALVPGDDPAEGARELERCVQRGLRGGAIWGDPPRDRRYDHPSWDPLWAAAQDLGVPLSLHILTDREGHGAHEGSVMKRYPSLHHAMERSIGELILGGALERFPRLNIVSAENDIGWIAHFLQRLDHAFEKYRYLEQHMYRSVIPEPPSRYFRRQVFATFMEDPVGVQTRHAVGVDRLMWASDFPHPDSTWPRSREVVRGEFEGVPSEELRRIVCDNCASLYGID